MPADLARHIEELHEEGLKTANIHALHVRENGMKPIDDAELAFKRMMDPYDLMNPGKFSADDVALPGSGASLPTSGWNYVRPADVCCREGGGTPCQGLSP